MSQNVETKSFSRHYGTFRNPNLPRLAETKRFASIEGYFRSFQYTSVPLHIYFVLTWVAIGLFVFT